MLAGRGQVSPAREDAAHNLRSGGPQPLPSFPAGTPYEEHELILAGPLGRPVDHRNVKKRHFHPLLAAAGLPRARPYDLRHTHCTLLLGAGVPVHVVSQRLGHASAKMTLDVYANCLPYQHEDASARYRAYVG
ncbi:MAG: tyrosine-type recombinase/integrase [Gemmatimonadales bacterium]|nr:tyrosine-type recombinase/integrase [Gemmatimonadales bacterium]MBP9202213.1 tyrosine-type recombinase/integrase [Gemmatimonadales bacterium]